MKGFHMPQASFHPPSPGGADLTDATRPNWVLLNFRAYIADHRNSTTTICMTGDKKEIQVTFFPAHPPQISYFCVYYPGEEPSIFAEEPKVIATDGDFVLLTVAIGSPSALLCPSPTLYEYYIYKASGGTHGGPLLELLPNPRPNRFFHEQVGLLSRGTEYTIAALRDDPSALERGSCLPGLYDVCLLDSETKVWTTKGVFVPLNRQQASNGGQQFRHRTSKVITIGGELGTMAFVDLLRGILLFNVFGGDPMIRYFTIPPQVGSAPGRIGDCSPWHTNDRDIAVVNGRFKLIEFQDKICPLKGGGFINDGWIAATWWKQVTSSDDDSWCPGYNLLSRNIYVDHFPRLFELLPKLPDDEGKPQLILERLHTGHPTLSLHDDDIVYLMTKAELCDSKAWIIAVDMSNGTVQGVAEFGAERTLDITLTYTQSRISKHLIMAPAAGAGTKGEEKRPGSPLL